MGHPAIYIDKDERILKYDYNHGLKNLRYITFAPKMRLKISHKRDKK